MNARTALQYSAEPVGARQTARELQVDALKRLIERHAVAGVVRGGHRWAALPQPVLLSDLNARLPAKRRVSLRTLQNLIQAPGIVRKCTMVGDRKVCLLRVGAPDPADPERDERERLVRVLASTWRRRAGRVPTARDYGLIRELAKGVPEDGAPPEAMPAILSWTIRNWPAFMAGARCDPEWRGEKYYRYPSLSVIVKFRSVAVEGYWTFVVEPELTRRWMDGRGSHEQGRFAESFIRESNFNSDSILIIKNKSLKKDSAIIRIEDAVVGEADSGVALTPRFRN
jgi:hypothetical protein